MIHDIRHYIRIVESSDVQTVTLLDLYDERELTDPREMLHNYAGPFSDWQKPMTVRTMTPEQAKTFRKAESDMTVVDAFKKHATKAQKALVREKAKNFDHGRIIVVADDMVVDGNHHLVAAIMAKQPIRYVDVVELG